MQEQQQINDNMIANTISINNLQEKFQPLNNSTIVETSTTSQMSGICYINNNNNLTDINKTSPLSMPSGIIIMQPIQQNNLKFYTENIIDNNNQLQNNDNNELYKNTSENTKDLLLNTTNYSQKTTIINNNINSHYNNNNNNSNIIKINSTITKQTTENYNDKKCALNCKTNSDNNLLLLNNYNDINNYNIKNIQQNYYNNKNLKQINKIDKIQQQSTISSHILTPQEPLTINKNIIDGLSSSSLIDHENVYNQMSYVENVHNYSKKSNGYILSSCGSNNTSSGTDEYETDDNCNDDDDELIHMNKNNKNINFDNDETDKWLKVVKNHNQNKILKRNINNNYDVDVNVNEKLIITMKSKTPDSGVPDDDDKLTPDHHARRPMNAFLIFCKRHRAIVRDRYKNVENRQITKILGEWWANMTGDEKSCYANLAKENKDQFLSANPNFKWYKLPAPPLRTLTTRPLNNNTSDTIILKKDDDKNQLNQLDFNEHITLKQQQHKKKLSINTKSQVSNVGVFKFADEKQMGSLNNLICGGNDGNTDNSPTHSTKSSSLSPNNDQQQNSNELQNVLGETLKSFPTLLHEPFENMRDHAKKMKNAKKNYGIKRKLPITNIYNNDNGSKKLLRDNSFSSSEDDGNIINRKLSRTCKGKKYQELINSGQISILSKKPKMKLEFLSNSDHSYSNGNANTNYLKDSSSDSDYYNNISPNLKNEFRNNYIDTNNINNNNNNNKKMYTTNSGKFQSIDNNTIMKKQYDMIDFDLDRKIMELPAQDLDQYLIKKQESKTKKKINSKRRKTTTGSNKKHINNITNCNNGIGFKEQQQQQQTGLQIVGSQKRKARKESITRRDISAEIKLFNFVEFGTVDEIEIKEEISDPLEIDISDEQITEQHNIRATDLLILAEVASNVDE